MTMNSCILFAVNGLFDFDFTFLIQGFFFLILSVVISRFFLKPLSQEIDKRGQLIDYSSKKSMILITLGVEKVTSSIQLITNEVTELNRQQNHLKSYVNQAFEGPLFTTQSLLVHISEKIKGNFKIQSAFLLIDAMPELKVLTTNFVEKKMS
jgi:hypothetical protein